MLNTTSVDVCMLFFYPKPTVFTGYSALDFASHDAANLPLVLRELEAQWVVPLQPNVYRISVIPDPSLPPMPLWRLSGEPPLKYSGASAKHAGMLE